MPRASAAHASEMRDRILDGAHHAMLHHGYRGATMPEIAAQAGVSVGLLYRYFENKEELYLEMCQTVTEAQLDELAKQLAAIPDPRDRLASAIGMYVESLEAERWGTIITTGWAEADVRPALRDMLRRRCDQIRVFVAMFLREAVARGELDPDADLESLGLAATMLLDGVIAHQAEMGDRFDAERATAAVIALMERALTAPG